MIDDERSDSDLLAAHVAGDPDAFAVLFRRHRDRLWAVALRTMGNPDDAADGLQDGMIAAWRRASSYRGEARVTTWLHRVVVNACLDRLRAAKVRAADPLPDDLEEHAGRGSSATGTGDPEDPAQAVVAEERRRAVVAALAQLPAEQRAALVLVDLEGWSVADAAVALGCAEGTVKSRCARGRARLAGLLGHLVADSDDDTSPVTRGNRPAAPAVPSGDPVRGPPPGTTPADPPTGSPPGTTDPAEEARDDPA